MLQLSSFSPFEGSMQIIHLTDLHYTRNSPFQIQLIQALRVDLKKIMDDGASPDFLIFSGDLVNDPDEAGIYDEFEERFLKPVLEILLLSSADVIFCPGNHDVSRKAIGEWADERKKLVEAMDKSQQALNDHLKLAPTIAYAYAISSGFFDLAKKYGHEWTNPYTKAYNFAGKSVSFVAINTGYACGLEGSKYDRGKLGLAVGNVLSAFQDVTAGHKTYSLMHHTAADLNEHTTRLFLPILFKQSALHMFGHVHQANPIIIMSPGTTCYTVQGGALYEKDGQYNGYSVITLAEAENYTSTAYRTYWVDRHEFDIGTNVTSGGVFYSTPAAQSYWTNLVPAASNDDVSYWLLESLPGVAKELDKTMTSKRLRDIFVEPIITKSRFDDESGNRSQRISVLDILKSTNHAVISAASEYGGTSLLNFIVMSYHEECASLPKAVVPTFVDARRIKGAYEAAVNKALRDGLPESEDRRLKLSPLHDSGRLVVVCDDIDPRKPAHVNFVKAVRALYPKARLIVGIKLNLLDAERLRPMIGISDYDLFQIAALSRGKVRTLVEKWQLPSRYQTDTVVDEIHSRFQALGIPRTAAYVAIYLAVLEDSEGYDPLNSSTVIENFVESSLQKHKPQFLFRSSFDYRNQIDYLGAVAENMCRENRFVIPYEDIYKWTKGHFEGIGQEHDYGKLIRHFIDAKVFADEGNSIYFRYNIFLSFFVAHRMQQSQTFRKWMLDDNRYANYISEFDIYCGLSRQDEETLEFFGKEFAGFEAKLEALVTPLSWTDRLEKLSVPAVKKTDVEAFTSNIEKQLTNGATPAERDEEFSKQVSDEENVRPQTHRPEVIGLLPNWVMSLRAYTVALKNLENIPREKKEQHLSRILTGWSKLALYACIVFKNAIEKRQLQIGDMILEIDLPAKLDARILRMFFLTIPVYVSELLRRDLGSQKLQLQLKNEQLARSLSDSFLQTSVYADLKLPEYINRLKAFQKKSEDSHIFLEILLLKMRTIFLRLGLQEDEQLPFLAVAAEISADIKGLTGDERTKEIDRYTHDLRRLGRVNKLRDNM